MLSGIDTGGLMLAEIPEWLTTTWSYFLVVLGFSVVVFVHELGHFLAAKWAGVRVERFAIGFGRELFGFTRGETRYSFNVLPLGGYVKMLGQEDFVIDKEGELKVKEDERSFTNKSVGKRMVIVTSGVIMNLVFAAVVFTIVFMVGRFVNPAIVGFVRPESPAGRAGVQSGDKILSINGDRIRTFEDLHYRIALSDPDEPLVLDVERDGKPVTPSPRIIPEYVDNAQIRQIGVGPGQNLRVAYAPSIHAETPRADELQAADKIEKVIIDGEPRPVRNLGEVRRILSAAQGEPVRLIVSRPNDPKALTTEELLSPDASVPSTEQTVAVQAVWLPLPFDEADNVTASLLGLIPRMSVIAVEPGKSWDVALIKPGDVVVRVGKVEYPTFAELNKLFQEGDGADIEIEVRRSHAANKELGLSARAVDFLVERREQLIALGHDDLPNAVARTLELAGSAGLEAAEIRTIEDKLGALADAKSWRAWLEKVDTRVLGPIRPKRPFALFSTPPVTIDAALRCIDEEHLVVADVREHFGNDRTPAHKAEIPRGAVIVSVNGEPVGTWSKLTQTFRRHAGQTVQLTYRVVNDYRTVGFEVPSCIATELNLTNADRIVSIDGKTSCSIRSRDEKLLSIALPDWKAVRGLLSEARGRTVTVEYMRDGEKRQASFAVTAQNYDPWTHRVYYNDMVFDCWPLRETLAESNPVAACITGISEAHKATMRTIQSIRHMLFTRQVGVNKVSGPLGIAHTGSMVARSSMVDLLWFLGLISANLAVINFLPLPIVDGGLFLFLVLEKIRGEPVSIKLQVATQLLGIALIATLFILVTYQDILKMFS